MKLIDNFEFVVAINTVDETAFVGLRPLLNGINLVGYAHEIFLLFNTRPKMTLNMIKHPGVSNITVDTRVVSLIEGIIVGGFKATAENTMIKISKTPLAIELGSKPDQPIHQITMFYFNRAFPTTRYINRAKWPKKEGMVHLPYDSYIPCMAKYVRDLAALHYTYCALSTVAAALLREKSDYPSDIKWETLVSNTQAYVEIFVDRSAEWSLKVKISLMAKFVSVLYEKLNEPSVTTEDTGENQLIYNDIKAQLQRLYIKTCDLSADQTQRNFKEFGHLLAVYAFENAPQYVVGGKYGNTSAPSGKTQEVKIIRLLLADDNKRQNHSRRFSVNILMGTGKEYFWSLKDIMCPPGVEKISADLESKQIVRNARSGVVRPDYVWNTPRPMDRELNAYWQKKFDLRKELPNRYINKRDEFNQYLLPISLDSKYEFGIRLDDFYTNFTGVYLKDGVKANKRAK